MVIIKKMKTVSIFLGGYLCSNRYKNKKCDASSMRHKFVEKAFVNYINNIEDFNALDEFQVIAKEKIKNQNLECINNLRKEYKGLESKEKEVLKLYIDSKVDFDNYIEIKKSIEEEKTQISSTIERLNEYVDEEITIKKENIIKSLKENWELLSNSEKRQFLVNFVEKIVIVNEKKKDNRNGNAKILDVEFSKY